MSRLKPLLTTLVVTGALAGGGAAVATAATSTSTSPATTSTSAATTSTTGSTAPAQSPHPGAGTTGSGTHNCPHM
jgi:hypothetical protein